MIINDPNELCHKTLKGNCRVLCLDYGDKRVGVAISDINWMIASPFKVLESHGVYKDLLKLIEENNIGVIVVGAPRALNGGGSGKQFEKVKKFVEKLNELLPEKLILFWDERLSSVAATRFLDEAGMNLAQKKKNIDKVAASFILQGVLNYFDLF